MISVMSCAMCSARCGCSILCSGAAAALRRRRGWTSASGASCMRISTIPNLPPPSWSLYRRRTSSTIRTISACTIWSCPAAIPRQAPSSSVGRISTGITPRTIIVSCCAAAVSPTARSRRSAGISSLSCKSRYRDPHRTLRQDGEREGKAVRRALVHPLYRH